MTKEGSPWEKLVVRLISPTRDNRSADSCDTSAMRRGSPTLGVHAGRHAMWMKARLLALVSALVTLSFITLKHNDFDARFAAAPPATEIEDRSTIQTFEGQCDWAAAAAGNRRISLGAAAPVSKAAGEGVNSTVDGWWEGCDGSDGRLLDPDMNVWLPSWLRRKRLRYCRRRGRDSEPSYRHDEGGGVQCREVQAIVLLQVSEDEMMAHDVM